MARQRRGAGRRATRARRPVGRLRAGALGGRARTSLRRFRQGSIVAVALTALLLMLLPGWEQGALAEQGAGQDAARTEPGDEEPARGLESGGDGDPGQAVEEAAGILRRFVAEAYGLLPKLAIAAAVLLVAWALASLLRRILRRALAGWQRGEAAGALAQLSVFVLALAVAMSVLVGDIRALVGSVGLVGLALSWALQGPIESLTGWLLNSFRGYYRVGDRIEVGEVFGDVYEIDALTTSVWQAGGPDNPVRGAQPTGALVTFPNSEVLRNNVVNFTRDFPYVWDEVVFAVANESDLAYSAQAIEGVARSVVGEVMAGPVREYKKLLERRGLDFEIALAPQVFLSLAESWAEVTVRYLVAARERRRWSSQLVLAVSEELAKAEHRGRILPAYPTTTVRLPG